MNEKDIVKLYTKENLSTGAIAKRYNTYTNKIRRILLKAGVDLKSKSEAQRNALKSGAAKHPTEGRERSENEKVSIGKAMKQFWKDIDPKELERRKEISKTQWENMSESDKEAMRAAAHAAMREASKDGSKFERWLREELLKEGHDVSFHEKHQIGDESLELDVFISDLRAIIEVDGPSHFMPIWGEDRLAKQIAADARKNGLAMTNGFTMIRLMTKGDGVCFSDRIRARDLILDTLSKIKDNTLTDQYIEMTL